MPKVKSKTLRSLKCDIAGCEKKDFSSQWVLDRHFERTHGNDYACPVCDERFKSRGLVAKHRKKAHQGFSCHVCYVRFSSPSALNRHHDRFHSGTQVAVQTCMPCKLQFSSRGEYKMHVVNEHTNETSFKLMNQAFKKIHQDWRKVLATTMQPESLFYGDYNAEIIAFLKNQQALLKTFTYNLVLVCIYESPIPGANNDSFRQGKLNFLFLIAFFQTLDFETKFTHQTSF